MGEVRLVDFRQTPVIGTAGLGGCNVALVVSKLGAIMAHIPPTTAPDARPDDGDANLKRLMNEVFTQYDNNRALFPTAGTHVVCAYYLVENAGVLMQDHVDTINNLYFQRMGLTTNVHYYMVPRSEDAPAGQGTVVVESGTVYVEDEPVATAPDLPQGPTTAARPSGTQGHLGYANPRQTAFGYTPPAQANPMYPTPGYGAAQASTPVQYQYQSWTQGDASFVTAQAPTPALYQDWTQGNAPVVTTQGYTTAPDPGWAQGYTTAPDPAWAQGYTTAPDSAWAQGYTTAPDSAWAQDNAPFATAQGSTTTLAPNSVAYSTTTQETAQESLTTMDSDWAQNAIEAQGSGPATASAGSWIKVDVEVRKRHFLHTQFIFQGQRGKQTTVRENWKEERFQGETVWTCRAKRTGITYYTDMDIKNA